MILKLIQKYLKIFTVFVTLFTFVVLSILISKNTAKASTKVSTNTLFVDIKGAINSPGVYELNENSRIIDLINKAGGLSENADTSIINLSKKLKDEDYIIIYTKDEVLNYKDKIISSKEIVKEIEKKIICPNSDNDGCISNTKNNKTDENKNNLININIASLEELQTLSGIGENKAKKIIEYREKQKFNSIEDIKNVSGIGESLFEKIKDNITV